MVEKKSAPLTGLAICWCTMLMFVPGECIASFWIWSGPRDPPLLTQVYLYLLVLRGLGCDCRVLYLTPRSLCLPDHCGTPAITIAGLPTISISPHSPGSAGMWYFLRLFHGMWELRVTWEFYLRLLFCLRFQEEVRRNMLWGCVLFEVELFKQRLT